MKRALLVLALSGCATQPVPEDDPKLQRADYTESACQSGAAFVLISAIGLPGYLVASGFANRACAGVAK